MCPECGYPVGQLAATKEGKHRYDNLHASENTRRNSMQGYFSFVLGQASDYIYESFLIAKDCFFIRVFDFSGCATRREFFSFVIIWGIVGQFFAAIAMLTAILIVPLVALFTFLIWYIIAGLAVTMRRLHDGGHSGWWVLFPPYCFFYMFQGSVKSEYQSPLE